MIPPHDWIAEPAALPALATRMAAAPWVAIDTEANSMHAYRERTCLVQLNAGGHLAVLDALALARAGGDGVLAPLAPVLGDAGRTLWIHGGEHDVAILRRDFGLQLRGVFDTQQAATMLGWPETGYGALVAKVCGVQLDKSWAQYDWGTRPLDPTALGYAIGDVTHLPVVAEHLKAAVAAADLAEEVAIACAAVEEAETRTGFDPAGFWRIKGVRELGRPCLPVLAALWAWRDAIAAAADQPAGRMLNNEVLLVLARQAPTSFQHLKSLGAKGWFLSAHGEACIDVIRKAKAEPPAVPAPVRQREVDPDEERREKRLKDWRRDESARRGVPLAVVLPSRAIDHLKRFGAGDLATVPQLGAKRIARYGERIRAVLA